MYVFYLIENSSYTFGDKSEGLWLYIELSEHKKDSYEIFTTYRMKGLLSLLKRNFCEFMFGPYAILSLNKKKVCKQLSQNLWVNVVGLIQNCLVKYYLRKITTDRQIGTYVRVIRVPFFLFRYGIQKPIIWQINTDVGKKCKF